MSRMDGKKTHTHMIRVAMHSTVVVPLLSFIFVSLGVDNERAGAGRDGQTCLARPDSQARTRVQGGKFTFPCSADHEQN